MTLLREEDEAWTVRLLQAGAGGLAGFQGTRPGGRQIHQLFQTSLPVDPPRWTDAIVFSGMTRSGITRMSVDERL